MKLSKLHAQIANIRNDETHKLTSKLAKKYGTIGIEDLNVSGMSKNHRLALAVLDMSFFELHRQIEYKSKMQGGHVIIADRFYPSNKTCSACGYKYDELTLSVRDWTCPSVSSGEKLYCNCEDFCRVQGKPDDACPGGKLGGLDAAKICVKGKGYRVGFGFSNHTGVLLYYEK